MTPPSSAASRPPRRATTPKPVLARPGSIPRTIIRLDSALETGCLAAAAQAGTDSRPADRDIRPDPPASDLIAADETHVLRSGDKQALRLQLAESEAKIKELEAKLDERQARDPCTRLYSHDAFRRAAGGELSRAERDGRPVSVAVVDIDGFRSLNARRGAEAGDAALASVALHLRRLTRATDCLGRTGADELAVLMPGTDLAGAQACCERLIAELEARDVPGAGFITVSAGVATHEEGMTLDDLLAAGAGGLDRARALGGARAAIRLADGIHDPNPAHAAVVEALASALLERDRYTG